VTPGVPGAGWTALAGGMLGGAATLFGDPDGNASAQFGVRHFTARPEDLPLWDALVKHGPGGGYSYGTAWRSDGKIAGNISFREVGPPTGAGKLQPVDNSGLVMAVAMAQVAGAIDRLTAAVVDVGRDVKSIVETLEVEQEADILAAVETIDDSYTRYRVCGRVGQPEWVRVAHLEQRLKQQHRRILAELTTSQQLLAFTDIGMAAESTKRVQPGRVRDLLTLEYFLLRAFAHWTELMLSAKWDVGDLIPGEVEAARDRVEGYQADARALMLGFAGPDEHVAGRPWWRLLMTDGLVIGGGNDDEKRENALANRKRVRKVCATAASGLEPVEAPALYLVSGSARPLAVA